MYILAYNQDKQLTTATNTLKTNLKNYLSQYKLVTDAINIKDAFVVNIGVRYEIVLRPSATAKDVLTKCTEALQDYFKIEKWSINQPVNLSKLYTLLDRVKGVQTVQHIELTNKAGGEYSQYGYDITGATKNNIVYPSYDPCIFELKYPNTDIEGRIVTL
jgi:phage-related baseplate assembly protein